MRGSIRVWLMGLFATLLGGAVASAADGKPPEDADLATLAAAGVTADAAGLGAYLKRFQPDPDRASRVAGWIRQLGSLSYAEREGAMKALAGLAVLPRPALEAAVRSEDAEIQTRAKALLSRQDDPTKTVLPAALAMVAKRKVPGLAAEVLVAGGYCDAWHRWREATDALVATAAQGDVAFLRSALGGSQPWARAAAGAALNHLLAAEADADLQKLLEDADERVRLRAGRMLADRGSRASLAPLAKLLLSEDGAVRWQSLVALRWLSGKRLGYNPDGSAAERTLAAEKWLAWARGEGQTAKLRFPVQGSDGIELFNGTDLTGWRAVDGGKEVDPKLHWAVQGGVLTCRGAGRGYLWYKRPFADYELTLQWRWPGKAGDSGVWFLMATPGGARPACLEAQLLAGNAGDFWVVGGMAVNAGGQRAAGVARKLAASSEKPLGQWNRMTIRVLRGEVTVKVNGVEQNKATGCPRVPGHIALQDEGTAIEFREIRLRPLGK